MILEDQKQQIVELVYKICEQEKVEVRHEFSSKSDSMYFRVFYNGAHVSFRISDHMPSVYNVGVRKMKNFIIQNKCKMSNIERFVRNRIKGVKYICIDVLLSQISYSNKVLATA